MDSQTVIRSALLGLIALGATGGALAADEKAASKEKCYGVAKAGQNDCANADGTHACAGQSKQDRYAGDWKYVATGTCTKLGGRKTPPEEKKS
jgi:uncharacterized membrane protein